MRLINHFYLHFIGLREASAKRHCTVGEAIQVGRDMKAYRIFLTHFSQRYPSVPALPHSAVDYALLAFDFMKINFCAFSFKTIKR